LRRDRRVGFFAAEWGTTYVGVFVVPKEEGEREEREVVVSSLEAREAGQHNHGNEQFLYVLDHFKLTITIIKQLP